jgi:hypothetical protein
MHPAIRQGEIAQVIESIDTLAGDGIEDTHLDVRVVIQEGQGRVVDRSENVVQQQAYPDSPFRRLQELGGKDEPRIVRLHQEILGVDTDLSPAHQCQARAEGIEAFQQGIETVAFSVAMQPVGGLVCQGRIRRILQGNRGIPGVVEWRTGATGKKRRHEYKPK